MEERWSSKVFMDTGSNELFLKTTELHSQANRRISQIFCFVYNFDTDNYCPLPFLPV